MLPLHRKSSRLRNAKPTCQMPNPMPLLVHENANSSSAYEMVNWKKVKWKKVKWKKVKWCVINFCFSRDQLKDEVKQLLIIPIVIFYV